MLETIYTTYYNIFFENTEIFTDLSEMICYMLSIATIATVIGVTIAVIYYAFRSLFDLVTTRK